MDAGQVCNLFASLLFALFSAHSLASNARVLGAWCTAFRPDRLRKRHVVVESVAKRILCV